MKVNTCLNLDDELLCWYVNKYGAGKLSMFVSTSLEKAVLKNFTISKNKFNGINVHVNVGLDVKIYKSFLTKNGKGKISIYINHFLNELKNETIKKEVKAENKEKINGKSKVEKLKNKLKIK